MCVGVGMGIHTHILSPCLSYSLYMCLLHTNIYAHYTYIHSYIHKIHICTCRYIYMHKLTAIYMYIKRVRGRERESQPREEYTCIPVSLTLDDEFVVCVNLVTL